MTVPIKTGRKLRGKVFFLLLSSLKFTGMKIYYHKFTPTDILLGVDM